MKNAIAYTHVTNKELSTFDIVEAYKNRPSPPYHAADFKNKYIIHNNERWMSRADRNGVYKWAAMNNAPKTVEQWAHSYWAYTINYDTKKASAILKKISKELLKYRIYLLPEIKWNHTELFIEDAKNKAETIMFDKFPDKIIWRRDLYGNYSFIFYARHSMFIGSIDGVLDIYPHVLDKDKHIVTDIFIKHFGKSYSWSGYGRKNIIRIKLPKL
jgi:hypothetical protein